MLIAIVVVIVFLLGYLIWRIRKQMTATEKYQKLMPPEKRLSWKIKGQLKSGEPVAMVAVAEASIATSFSPAMTNDSESTVEVGPKAPSHVPSFLKDPVTWAAAADGAIAGAFIADAALKIDPDVVHALEFSTAQYLHGLAGIDQYAQDHFFAVDTASADGWFERLSGYVAEQKAAAVFEHMGLHVDFAPAPNQPVWDMVVNGNHIQIKEGIVGVKEFIAQHPGVDVYAPADVAGAIKDPAVHALDVLDKDAIHAATQHTLDGIHGVVSPDIHIPYITLAFSSWREAKLLWNEKTTTERALKNVALDVGGVGAGALAGSKAGGWLGSIFGVFGSAIGAAVGAIIGGVSGKLAATGIRHIPFNNARDEYNTAVSNAQTAVTAEIKRSKERVRELQGEYQVKFLDERAAIENEAKNKLAVFDREYDATLLAFCESFPIFLGELKKHLAAEEQETLSHLPVPQLWTRLFPSEQSLYRLAVKGWFKRARTIIDTEVKDFKEVQPRNVKTLHAEIQRFLREYTFELDSLSRELTTLLDQQKAAKEKAELVRKEAVERTESGRTRLIRSFREQVTGLQEEITRSINHWNGIIAWRRNELKEEAAAAGINL